MITKAIVEEVLTAYQVKVRIPIFDRSNEESLATATQYLHTATICTLPNCYASVQVGDVVFVGFEDNKLYKPVILGHLSKEAFTSTYVDMTVSNITVNTSAHLPQNTTIGTITPDELLQVKGAKNNLQAQIDILKQNQEQILEALNLK